MASIGLGLAGLVGGVTSAVVGSNAAQTASQEQATAAQNALNFEQQIYGNEQGYQSPYITAGQTSLGTLMQNLGSGTYNVGAAPSFTAPTLTQAQQTPGYQFTQQQGSKGILEGAAAAGGAISGGTLKSLDQYNQNLANTTYQNVYNQSLSTYGANLSQYQANLAAQQQAYSQQLAPATLGENAASSLSMAGNNTGNTISGLMTNLGNAQAAGNVGSANAINSGIGTATNTLTQTALINALLGNSGASTGSSSTMPVTSGTTVNSTAGIQQILAQLNQGAPVGDWGGPGEG